MNEVFQLPLAAALGSLLALLVWRKNRWVWIAGGASLAVALGVILVEANQGYLHKGRYGSPHLVPAVTKGISPITAPLLRGCDSVFLRADKVCGPVDEALKELSPQVLHSIDQLVRKTQTMALAQGCLSLPGLYETVTCTSPGDGTRQTTLPALLLANLDSPVQGSLCTMAGSVKGYDKNLAGWLSYPAGSWAAGHYVPYQRFLSLKCPGMNAGDPMSPQQFVRSLVALLERNTQTKTANGESQWN